MEGDLTGRRKLESTSERPHGSVTHGQSLGGRFTVQEFLSARGFCERYAAVDDQSSRPVELRLLPIEKVDTKILVPALSRAQTLTHKNLAVLHSFGEEGRFFFIASEAIDGHNLRTLIEERRRAGRAFSLKGAYNVVAHLCNALGYVHQNIAHGGLSSDNVWVNRAGRVKITELGLGRLGGLPPIDAPELATVGVPTRASDIFSIGVILFELLAGRLPERQGDVPSRHQADVPPNVDAVVSRCLDAIPEERFLSTDELKQALLLSVEQAAIPQTKTAKGVPLARGAEVPEVADVEPVSGPAAAAAQAMGGSGPQAPSAPGRGLPWPIAATSPTPPPGVAVQAVPQITQPPFPGSGPTSGPVPDPSVPVMDESLEIWLIRKDRLDFGPFSMAEVKRQILKGEISSDHLLIDSDGGKQWRVGEHPYLAKLVAETEMRREERRSMETHRANQLKSRRSIIIFTLFLAIAGAAGAVTYMHQLNVEKEKQAIALHEATQRREIEAKRQSDTELAEALKGLHFEMQRPVIKSRKVGKGGKKGFAAGDDFDEPTRLGDATQEGGEEQLKPEQIQGTINSKGRSLALCIAAEKRRDPNLHQIELEFIVHSNGQVTAVRANGQKGTPLQSCMFSKMQRISFPKYNGPKTIAGFTWNIK